MVDRISACKNYTTWLNPRGSERQISATIQDITLGKNQIVKGNEHCRYQINVPNISMSTYWEIVNRLLTANKITSSHEQWKHLTVNKNNNNVRKNMLKSLILFAQSICPSCQTYNCAFSCNIHKKKKLAFSTPKKKFIKCFHCQRVFKTQYHAINHINYKEFSFKKCIKWECRKCKNAFEKIYSEFLSYLVIIKKRNEKNGNDKKSYLDIQSLFESLSDSARKELNNDYQSLYYAVKINNTLYKNNETIIIPPFAFIAEMNKQISFYNKLIVNNRAMRLDVKTKYGSVNSRARGGKNSFFRSCCLNKRYVLSARVIIVPSKELQPHECILPKELYRRLNCPKVIAGHRYPTLDVRSITYHRVVGTWEYPCLGISTAVVSGNNADFDGDCLHIIPVTSLQSRAELEYLGNPKYNIIVQNQLRVKLDHDEVQTLYSQFGITSQQIHEALLQYAKRTSSPEAYRLFCQLRRHCHWVWQYYSYLPTVSFRDFLEIHKKCKKICTLSYQSFIDKIYPRIKPENGIKEIILSKSSRFSIDHLWQIYGEINKDAKMSFLVGMDKLAFIKMAIISRGAIIKDVAYYGYAHIKLTHCTKSITVGYDGKLYTTDGILVGTRADHFCGKRNHSKTN